MPSIVPACRCAAGRSAKPMPATSNSTSSIASSEALSLRALLAKPGFNDPETLVFRSGATEAALKLTVSPRARVMRLKVDPRTAEVLLTVPRRVSRRKALEWAAGHRGWIEQQLARIEPAQGLVPGAEIRL